jgi:lipopolysaccharide/colanic/teichoic acid biosynthesis glycosyltransferase
VNYKYGATETDAMEKLQYELYYVQQSSVLINIVILLKTVQTVLLKPGS